ncbi:hypothetical protein [Nonomuraea sp. NPDC049141]|uniref:hypothetical protein n=1 Tax=Nonomuraea sp. NPDC049141 TaxID=3155500 RepID=UPI0033EB0165
MQTNDIQLSRVFTTKASGGTQDNTPTELGGNRQPEFYLTIVAESGDNLGDLGAAYTLYVRAASTSGGATGFARMTQNETVTSGLYDWKDLGANNGYAKISHIRVNSADFPAGDSYEFVATLVTKSGIVSKAVSNEFVSF